MIAKKYMFCLLSTAALTMSIPAFADTKHKHADDKPLPEGAVAATVNKQPIAQMAADRVAEQIAAQGQPADPKQILEELINLEVLTQKAEEMGLDKKEEVATALNLQYTQTMANAYLAAFSNDVAISEEDIRAEYDKQIALIKADEYQASHILVESEEEATTLIKELADGGDFAELAKEHSIGPTGVKGGDLGWFQPENMVPEFSAALEELSVGESSTEAVKTQFGWHIIQLNDKRAAAKPDYSPAVKAGIENTLLREAMAAHVEELRNSAEVEYQ